MTRLVRRRTAAILSLFAAAIATLPLQTAHAQNANDPTIVVEQVAKSNTGIYGYQVLVSSRRPLRGILELSSSSYDRSNVTELRVELPTAGEQLVWIPSTSRQYSSGSLRFRQGTREIETAINPISAESNSVAVLPSLHAAIPGSRSTDIGNSTGRATLIRLSIDDLERSRWLLESVDALALSSGDVRQLSPATIRSVLGWMRRGGIVLADDDGAHRAFGGTPPINGIITDAVQVFGSLRATNGALARSEWFSQVPELANRYVQTEGLQSQSWRPQITLSGRSFRRPPGGLLLFALTVYAAFTGPVVFLLLRRRRPTAIWVVGPLVATVCAGFVGVVGGVNRRGNADRQVVVFEATGDDAEPRALVERTFTSSRRLDLPANWIVSPTAPPEASRYEHGTRPRLRVSVLSGGVSSGVVVGPVDAAIVPAKVTVTLGLNGPVVRNEGTTAVRSLVRVINGLDPVEFPGLAPGEERVLDASTEQSMSDDGTLTYLTWNKRVRSRPSNTLTVLAVVETRGSPIGGPKPTAVAVAASMDLRPFGETGNGVGERPVVVDTLPPTSIPTIPTGIPTPVAGTAVPAVADEVSLPAPTVGPDPLDPSAQPPSVVASSVPATSVPSASTESGSGSGAQ